MHSHEPQRKILIIENEDGVRNLAHILLVSMGCTCTDVSGASNALQLLRRKTFDAVLLDLRCPDPTPAEVISGIERIQPNLLGRVLVITGEASDQETMELVESNCLPTVPRSRILQELWNSLQRLLGAKQPSQRAARLSGISPESS